ncbi:MAG: OmpH family outer membrane protein [Bacteroidales bacterium]|nr:OmpH family outer membrane protein [Bacteroidales bacterium]
MKLVRSLFFAVVIAMIPVSAMAQSPKFGHVNATFVLSKMPEYNDAMRQLSKLDSTYNLELEKLAVEINKKVDEYNKDTVSPQLLKDVKAQEIQELQVRAQQFQQRIEQDITTQQQQLIRPISNKVIKAINEIAAEKKLIYVFDVSSGNPVYVSDESLDLVPLLMEKFGIQYNPSELMRR